MTAREMFAELGYKLIKTDNYGTFYYCDCSRDEWGSRHIDIATCKNSKSFEAYEHGYDGIHESFDVSFPIFKAIMKQFEEAEE